MLVDMSTEVCKMVQKAASTFDKHGSSQFLHTEQKIWGQTNDSHFLQYIANYLISTSVENAQLLRKNIAPQITDNSQLRLTGRHFICKIKCFDGA